MRILLVSCLLLGFISDVKAQREVPVLGPEWTLEARLNLVKALVAEAGWRPCKDWQFIPWVIYKRRRQMLLNHHNVTYNDVLLSYSTPIKPYLATKAREWRARKLKDHKEVRKILRRRFIQSIEYDGSNIEELVKSFRRPAKASHYIEGWQSARAIVEAWGRGEVRNKCPRAEHWGHPNSRPTWERACLKFATKNHFYVAPRNKRKLQRLRGPTRMAAFP